MPLNRYIGKDMSERMNKTRDSRKLIVGLDIGTSKIATLVAEPKPEGGFELIGMGQHPSRGRNIFAHQH